MPQDSTMPANISTQLVFNHLFKIYKILHSEQASIMMLLNIMILLIPKMLSKFD